MANVKEQIREFALESARGKGINEVKDTDSLMEGGIIDSLGIFQLVSFLEETFSIKIGDEEIVTDNFQTIDEIDRFVTAKLSAKGKATTTA